MTTPGRVPIGLVRFRRSDEPGLFNSRYLHKQTAGIACRPAVVKGPKSPGGDLEGGRQILYTGVYFPVRALSNREIVICNC